MLSLALEIAKLGGESLQSKPDAETHADLGQLFKDFHHVVPLWIRAFSSLLPPPFKL